MAPTALHIPYVQENLRKDFKVAAQNAWVKGSGAYTGEIRHALAPTPFPDCAYRAYQSSMGLMHHIVRSMQAFTPI